MKKKFAAMLLNKRTSTTPTLKGKHLAAAICLSLALNAAALTPALAENITYTGNEDDLQTITIGAENFTDSVFPGTPTAPLAEGNNVIINIVSGTNPTYVFGGAHETNLVQNNTVTVNNSSIVFKNVYGGYSNSGAANQNTVTINDSIVGEQIFGGYSNTGATNKNIVTINNSRVDWEVIGGSSISGEANQNTVIINNSPIRENVIGGNSTENNANQNTVIFNGGSIMNSVIGGMSGDGNANQNTVTVNDGTFRGTSGIMGGYSTWGEANQNTVNITGGDFNGNATGGYSTNGKASNNTINITGGNFSRTGYNNIIGGYYGSGTGEAINNTINILGNSGIDLSGAKLYGGNTFTGAGDIFTGNTLNINEFTGSVEGLYNFENYNFYLSNTINSGETILNISGVISADLAGTTVTLTGIAAGSNLAAGDSIILIDKVANNFDSFDGENVSKGLSFLANVSGEVNSNNQLIATINSIKINPGTKSFNAAYLSGLAYLKDVETFLVDKSFKEAKKAASEANGKTATFFSFAGASDKHETNSHIDVDSYTLLGGIAKDHKKETGTLTTSLFLEGGWGDYDTYNSFSGIGSVKGSGDVKHFGVGFMAKNQKNNGSYLEGSLRGGKLWNEFKHSTFGSGARFNADSNFVSAHVGVGKEKIYNNESSLDTSLKLLWTRLGSDSVKNRAGETLEFNSANSFRVRLGTKLNKNLSQKTSWYAGIAAEYEFDGEQNGKVEGHKIERTELKHGVSGLIELGFTTKPSEKWQISLNALGLVGAREGIGGNLTFSYIF